MVVAGTIGPLEIRFSSAGFGGKTLHALASIHAVADAAGNRETIRGGIPGMKRAAAWLKEQGAIVELSIEDPDEGHGALQRNPQNARRVLDLFLGEKP